MQEAFATACVFTKLAPQYFLPDDDHTGTSASTSCAASSLLGAAVNRLQRFCSGALKAFEGAPDYIVDADGGTPDTAVEADTCLHATMKKAVTTAEKQEQKMPISSRWAPLSVNPVAAPPISWALEGVPALGAHFALRWKGATRGTWPPESLIHTSASMSTAIVKLCS